MQMSDDRPPPFRIVDLLLIIAGTAIGLGKIRYMPGYQYFETTRVSFAHEVGIFIERMSMTVSPILTTWAVLAIIQIIRRPWPSRRLSISQPGFVACLAVAVSIVDALLQFALETFFRPQPIQPAYIEMLYGTATELIQPAGLLVIGSWLALALTGCRKPSQAWPDRFGCVVGIGWILLYMTNHFYDRYW